LLLDTLWLMTLSQHCTTHKLAGLLWTALNECYGNAAATAEQIAACLAELTGLTMMCAPSNILKRLSAFITAMCILTPQYLHLWLVAVLCICASLTI